MREIKITQNEYILSQIYFEYLILTALREISKKDLEYIDMRIYRNMKFKEIAKAKNISSQGAKRNVDIALKHLRQYLDRHHFEFIRPD